MRGVRERERTRKKMSLSIIIIFFFFSCGAFLLMFLYSARDNDRITNLPELNSQPGPSISFYMGQEKKKSSCVCWLESQEVAMLSATLSLPLALGQFLTSQVIKVHVQVNAYFYYWLVPASRVIHAHSPSTFFTLPTNASIPHMHPWAGETWVTRLG